MQLSNMLLLHMVKILIVTTFSSADIRNSMKVATSPGLPYAVSYYLQTNSARVVNKQVGGCNNEDRRCFVALLDSWSVL